LLRVAEAGEQPVDRVDAVAVAHLADLLVEALGAAAALVPPPEEVGQVGIEDARPPPVPRPRRGLRELPVAVDGALARADPLGDILDARPRQVQPPYVLPHLDEALVAPLGRPLDAPVRPTQADGQRRNVVVDGAWEPLLLSARSRCSGTPECGPLAQQELLQPEGEAVEEVPAVRDREGVRGARVDALPADTRAVAADHLDARVLPEPPRYGFDRVPLEEVHHPMALEVHQDGARGVAPPEAEVVHAHHAHFLLGVTAESPPDAVKEGVGADEQAELAGPSLAPASPPRAKAIHSSASLRRSVPRAWTPATSSSRSAKILRSQEGSSQKNFLTLTRRRTGIPPRGRSASVLV
jgi:hypothetical protein